MSIEIMKTMGKVHLVQVYSCAMIRFGSSKIWKILGSIIVSMPLSPVVLKVYQVSDSPRAC